ncbi:MAG: NAD(P)/FAD-dependent oxidoreductase [Acidobacteriota bacterium]
MDVTIIGAGLAGLTVAYTLTQHGLNCEVLEKSRALGGRMATRRYQDISFDHGAQYFTVKTNAFADFLHEVGVTEDMVALAAPVVSYPFQDLTTALAAADRSEVSAIPGFPHRYMFRSGMTTLAKVLVARIGASRVVRECFVEALAWDTTLRQWNIHTRGDNTTLGGIRSADWVILALPAPQAAQLLARSHPLPALFAKLQTALEGVAYHPCITVSWGTPPNTAYPGVGALRAISEDYPIGWLAWLDRLAPYRVPDGNSIVIAQFGPAMSHNLLDQPEGTIIQALATTLSECFQLDLPTLRWVNIKQWRYANPAVRLSNLDAATAVADFNIDICGDYLLGGRIEAAFLSGLAAADRLLQRVRRP